MQEEEGDFDMGSREGLVMAAVEMRGGVTVLTVVVRMEVRGRVCRETEACEENKGKEGGNGGSSRCEEYGISNFQVAAIESSNLGEKQSSAADFLFTVSEHRPVQCRNKIGVGPTFFGYGALKMQCITVVFVLLQSVLPLPPVFFFFIFF